jgi:hypothetical protein
MSKLNPQKFTLEDFPEQRSWIGNLFSPLNSFLGDVVRAFNNALTIEDNLYQEIREIKFKNSTNNFPYKFRTKFNSIPKGLLPIYLFNNDTGEYSDESPLVVWSYASNEVSISQISGLTSDVNYTIRVLILYG